MNISIKLAGYDTLGAANDDGIRYAWKHSSSNCYVESAAFSQRSKLSSDNVCGYTTSISSGCILSSMSLACKFCRTGTQLPFGGRLASTEIAKQNVFMVLADMYCSKHEIIRSNQREFAYMGQGEPGFSYEQVREAINITNVAMRELEQNVFRHIVATSGVPELIRSYKKDLEDSYFTSRVTMHFSLHGVGASRKTIMPIDTIFPYHDSLAELLEVVDISGEKPCIGILLLDHFTPKGTNITYTTDMDYIKKILCELNPEKVRLSFCEFNDFPDLGKFSIFNNNTSKEILCYSQKLGFEAKLFSSFGKEEVTACGMLGGKIPANILSEKWHRLELRAEEIVTNAMRNLIN